MPTEVAEVRPKRASQSRWPRFNVNQKMVINFLVILLVAVANVIVVQTMLRDLKGVAETVGQAGKLRVLSQKIAFETSLVLRLEGHRQEQAVATIDAFEMHLSGLELGGNVFGHNAMTLSTQITPLVASVRPKWHSYRSHIESLLEMRTPPGEVTAELARVHTEAGQLLKIAEAIVQALTIEAQQTQERGLQVVYALVVVDVLVLFGIFLLARKQIVHPLRDLTRCSRRFGAGDYGVRSNFRGTDEIGELAAVFNFSALQIEELVTSIDLDRQRLQRAESIFRGLAENSVVGVYIVQEHRFQYVNLKMAEMFSYTQGEMIASLGVLDIASDADRNLVESNIQKRLFGEARAVNYEMQGRKKDGATFDVEVFGSKMDVDGKTATIGIMLDITERKRDERALKVLSACNQALIRATDESALLTEICGIVQQLSGHPFVWVGYADDEASKLVRPAAKREAVDGALPFTAGELSWDDSARGSGVTGTAIRTGRTAVIKYGQSNMQYPPWRDFLIKHGIQSGMALPLITERKVIGALTIYAQDAAAFTASEIRIVEELAGSLAYGITALRANSARQGYAQQLMHQATHDVLTGLANRSLLSDRIKQAIASAERSGRAAALLLLDLDGFKVINDSLGHPAGDALLQAVAERLCSLVRKADTVARMGGDEFVIVLPGLVKVADASLVAGKILSALASPFVIDRQELHIGVSIGISLYPQDGTREEVLLKNVDLAMYRAKFEGRNQFHFYTEELNIHSRERLALASDLRFALERDELLLHYQPQVDLPSGEIVGVEALLRWQHPARGLLSPAQFIPIAEESGLIIPIGAWVIKAACAQQQAWRVAGLPPVKVAVNISAHQFRRHDLLAVVTEALQETAMEARYLELELTETAIMQEPEKAIPVLLELKALGLHLALDDFGMGYSSLNYLRQFPLDNLKIDRSFVSDLTSSSHGVTIVKTIISLAHSLNLKVIAEGAETKAQLDLLHAYGCDEVQGFYFSKPLPADELACLFGSWCHA